MPKQVSSNEFSSIWDEVSRFSEGASLDDLMKKLEPTLSRRTLQRRLAHLVDQGLLTMIGRGPAVRYHVRLLANRVQETPDNTWNDPKGEDRSFPLSPEAEIIKLTIRKPIFKRQPVGFNSKFLDAYIPNKTFYLPQKVRQRLLELGHSPDKKQPAGTYARQVYDRLLIDLSWNSSRLEGNTYSLLETERLLAVGESTEGKAARDAQMILNHKAAIEFLVDQAAQISFNRYTILNLHALLSENLIPDQEACGQLRTISVGISGTAYYPLAVPQLIEEHFDQMLDLANAIRDPFEQSFFVMVHMPYLQPFQDVNKRTSRLAANIPLIKNNLCPLSFVDVSKQAYTDAILGVYELNRFELLRDVFAWAYERSCGRYAAVCQSLGEPDPFRLRHRQIIAETVAAVVQKKLDKKHASRWIQQVSEKLPENLRARFIEAVETSVMTLHLGNIARFRLRPAEYEIWKKTWI